MSQVIEQPVGDMQEPREVLGVGVMRKRTTFFNHKFSFILSKGMFVEKTVIDQQLTIGVVGSIFSFEKEFGVWYLQWRTDTLCNENCASCRYNSECSSVSKGNLQFPNGGKPPFPMLMWDNHEYEKPKRLGNFMHHPNKPSKGGYIDKKLARLLH